MFTYTELFVDWAPFLVRLAVGVIFVLHGYPKLFGGFTQTAQFFESIGLRPAKFWTLVVGAVEFFGGLALLVGFLTQYAALLITIDMLGAILLVRRKFVGGWEFDFVLLMAALSLALSGAGAWSVDSTIGL